MMTDNEQSWGLNAFGVAAPFKISLHDRIDGAGWELEVACRATTVAVHLDSQEEVTKILAFMSEHYGKTKCRLAKEGEYPGTAEGTKLFSEVASLEIKTSGAVEAHLSKCGELPDRFCFGLASEAFRFHADLHDPETSQLISALTQVAAEMTRDL